MPKFKIKYFFEGDGEVEVEAKDEEEAQQLFYDGEWEEAQEGGENYEIFTIKQI